MISTNKTLQKDLSKLSFIFSISKENIFLHKKWNTSQFLSWADYVIVSKYMLSTFCGRCTKTMFAVFVETFFLRKNTIFDLPIESFKIKLETINKIGLYMFHLRKRCLLWSRKFANKAIMYESTLKIYFSLEIIFSKSCVSILTAY